MKKLITKAQTKFMMRLAGVREVPAKKERGDQLIQVLGLIIISVIILIFFRAQIVNLFKDAIDKTTNSVKSLFTYVATE